MPCHPEYPEVTALEKEIGKIYHLMDELDGKTIDRKWWASGLHHKVTGKNLSKDHLIEVTKELCMKLQGRTNLNGYSNELNRWWNKHKDVDKKRIKLEFNESTNKDKFIKALSHYERKLLEEIYEGKIPLR